MAENKASPQLWATVTIAVAIIACLGTITSAVIAKIPVSSPSSSTPIPVIVVVTEAPSFPSAKDTAIIYADVKDAEIGNVNCDTWIQCWNTSQGYFLLTGYAEGTVSADNLPEGFNVRRIFISFDTSSISSGAIVKKAELHFRTGGGSVGNPTIHIVNSTATIPLSYSGFGEAGNSSGGSASPLPYSWSTIQFSQEALTWIVKGGVSSFFLVHDLDLKNEQPTDANGVTISMAEAAEFRPYIELIFETP